MNIYILLKLHHYYIMPSSAGEAEANPSQRYFKEGQQGCCGWCWNFYGRWWVEFYYRENTLLMWQLGNKPSQDKIQYLLWHSAHLGLAFSVQIFFNSNCILLYLKSPQEKLTWTITITICDNWSNSVKKLHQSCTWKSNNCVWVIWESEGFLAF